MEAGGSLPHSQEPAIDPSACVTFHYMLIFYGEVLLAPCPTPNMHSQLSTTGYSVHSELPSKTFSTPLILAT
jgi:hypothetical protein